MSCNNNIPPRSASSSKNQTSNPPQPIQPSSSFFPNLFQILSSSPPLQTFAGNLPKNFTLGILGVPGEWLTLKRVIPLIESPQSRPLSYIEVVQTALKTDGIRGITKGAWSRVIYTLSGNGATCAGIYYVGDIKDPGNLLLITLAKNCLYPLSLFSNARQYGNDFKTSSLKALKGMFSPLGNASFFARNFFANTCVVPGFMVMDYFYKKNGEEDTKVPKLLGYATALVVSVAMNSVLKPLFVPGEFPVKNRYAIAIRFAAMGPLAWRESASLGILFGNLPPKTTS